jgi:hypothetical protein
MAGKHNIIFTTGVFNMKFVMLLALLSLGSIANTVSAEEENAGVGDDVADFCNEQAQMAGIEDNDEMAQYIQDCMDSYGLPSGDTQ